MWICHTKTARNQFCLLLLSRDRHFPNNSYSRGYVSDSVHPPFTSLNLRITPNKGQYTTGRLTKPYPGGPVLSHSPRNVEPEPGSNDNIFYKSVLRFVIATLNSEEPIFTMSHTVDPLLMLGVSANSQRQKSLYYFLSIIRLLKKE